VKNLRGVCMNYFTVMKYFVKKTKCNLTIEMLKKIWRIL
jgi:hypothetical protein